jgi:hypothetical protein
MDGGSSCLSCQKPPLRWTLKMTYWNWRSTWMRNQSARFARDYTLCSPSTARTGTRAASHSGRAEPQNKIIATLDPHKTTADDH